jgi:hypothetical protein
MIGNEKYTNKSNTEDNYHLDYHASKSSATNYYISIFKTNRRTSSWVNKLNNYKHLLRVAYPAIKISIRSLFASK